MISIIQHSLRTRMRCDSLSKGSRGGVDQTLRVALGREPRVRKNSFGKNSSRNFRKMTQLIKNNTYGEISGIPRTIWGIPKSIPRGGGPRAADPQTMTPRQPGQPFCECPRLAQTRFHISVAQWFWSRCGPRSSPCARMWLAADVA